MSIASELQNYADGLDDAWDAAEDMGATIPHDRNMVNLDDAIRTIPVSSPNDGVLTITQNGTTIQTFSADQATNVTAALTDTTYSNFTGATSSVAGAAGLVPAPTTADPDKFLKGDGSWGTPTDTTYTAGTNVSISAQNVISATDTTYSDFTGATSSVAGAAGLVPAPAAGDQGKALHGDGTWKDTTAKLVEMSYGESSAWAKFIAAYNAGSIVYCRASSNANPATGSQTRKAFMAYVNNATSPTNVEFQYVRSQSSKTDSQQCDQVFVYKLTNASGGTWTVETRNMAPKINVSGPITKTFTTGANATLTLGADAMTGATSSADGAAGIVPKPVTGDQNKVLLGGGTWSAVTGGMLDYSSAIGTAVIKTVSDLNGARNAIYYADGTLIAHRIVTDVVAVTTALGALYYGDVPVNTYYALVPYGSDDFISKPTVSVTATGSSTQYLWLAFSENSEPQNTSDTGNRWGFKAGSFRIMRATTNNNCNYALNIIAIGRWKA